MSIETGTYAFMEVARHYTQSAINIAQAYENEQSKLALDQVLTPARLDNSAGTAQSLAVLGQLRALTHAHKEVYGKYMIASTHDLTTAVKQLPQPQQDEQRNGIIASFNRQLALQADFYLNRFRWIDAASDMCNLVETNRSTVRVGPDGFDFVSDDDYERFTSLLTLLDEIHFIEVAAMEERKRHITRSMAILAG